MTTKPLNDCFIHDKDRLTHQEAIKILKSNINPLGLSETIPLSKALNRISIKEQTAQRPIPAHRNAAVDGYAFAYQDYDTKAGTTLKITDRITAGDPLLQTSRPQTAARIFTGAVMPSKYDTVAMQEDVRVNEERKTSSVIIPKGLKAGANCRLAGEDTKAGGQLVASNTRLNPQNIAALASAGIETIEVFKKVKVACLSTGNEIIRKEVDFTLGKVFDSNGPMLHALLTTQNCETTDLGIIKDNASEIENALTNASQTYDVIITSGGASKGEEDHIINSLNKLGSQQMWQLAIKPGRPMSFGQINNTIFIGLPGNPVAAFVCFLLYGAPILRRLGGENWFEPQRYQLPADFNIDKKKADRREFLRGKTLLKENKSWVKKFEKDGSGLIQSLTLSDGLIELDEETTNVKKGTYVNFLPFSQWGL